MKTKRESYADRMLTKLGFTKIMDDDHVVRYRRHNDKHGYTQILEIACKNNGRHIAHSYAEKEYCYSTTGAITGNCCVGMTTKELRCIARKMKEKGWVSE